MPTNTPSCTPKASGKTMKTKSVCDLAPWFLGRTPYFGLSMTLWLENLGKIFPFLVNFVPHLVGLPSLPKSLIFESKISVSRSKSLPFSILCMFFWGKKTFESSLFSPWKSVCFLFRGSKEPQFHGELAAPWAEVRTVPARASSASGEAGMPGEGVILLGRSV